MRVHSVLHKGRVVDVDEGGTIPGSETWPGPDSRGIDMSGLRYEIPMLSYFDPLAPGPKRRRWWGGHYRYGVDRETDLCEIYLGSRSRAERWLRRAGHPRVVIPKMVAAKSA